METPQHAHALALRLNLATEDRRPAARALRALGHLLGDRGFRSPSTAAASRDTGATAVAGVSARLFGGELTWGRDDRPPSRFGLSGPVPRCLRRMSARCDERFPGVAGYGALAAAESDVVVLAECDERRRLDDLHAAVDRLAGVVVRHADPGFVPPDGIGDLGYREGTSNLQDLDPPARARHVFVQPGDERDERLTGGTYLVLRTYRLHLERWTGGRLTVTDPDGRIHRGDRARDHIIGRSHRDGRVLDRDTGVALSPEPDAAEGVRAYDRSHIRHANPRGAGYNQFGQALSPPALRILRRPFSLGRPDRPRDPGTLFLCFQRDIQRRGFEFIHNNWMMPSGFLGGRDTLLSPATGIVEPMSGCYYFVPAAEPYPGALFLEGP